MSALENVLAHFEKHGKSNTSDVLKAAEAAHPGSVFRQDSCTCGDVFCRECTPGERIDEVACIREAEEAQRQRRFARRRH